MGPPKPESTELTPANSTTATAELYTYINFLAATSTHMSKSSPPKIIEWFDETDAETMAAIFDHDDAASPLHYPASHTALLLMDFQGFALDLSGSVGTAAVAKATNMRDWALKHGIMVVHSVVDASATPPTNTKGKDRINKLLDGVRGDQEAVEEPTELAFSQQNGEYIVLKPPGLVSALKSIGAMDLLKEHKIKSLILCGLSTSGGVLRTAVPATDEGFVVSVVSDACADPREGLHDLLVTHILPSRAHVATAEEFIEAWESMKGAEVAGKRKAIT